MPESGVSFYGVYSMAYILFLAIGGISVKRISVSPWRKGGIGRRVVFAGKAVPKTQLEGSDERASTPFVCERTDKVMAPIAPGLTAAINSGRMSW
jgi:hypothetical protein